MINCIIFALEFIIIVRGGAVVARWAHNPKVVSSSLAPATKKTKDFVLVCFKVFRSPFENKINKM